MKNSPPSFKMFPGDWLASGFVECLDDAEYRVYHTLLLKCWQRGGLPADEVQLQKISGKKPSVFCKIWSRLQNQFVEVKTDDLQAVLWHPKLLSQWVGAQVYRDIQRANGERGRAAQALAVASANAGANAGPVAGANAPAYMGNGEVVGSINPTSSEDIATEYGFAEFWKAYPRGDGKAKTRTYWLKLRPSKELRAQIMAALEKQKKSVQWTKDGGQFIPWPQKWVNERRWLDEEKDPDAEKAAQRAKDREQAKAAEQASGGKTWFDEALERMEEDRDDGEEDAE